MKLAMRHVQGSEGERELLWMKFTAMRVWNGCSIVFFTLNPHDIWNPLLVVYAGAEGWDKRRISLDWSDEQMKDFYAEARVGDALAFHRLAAENPCAAAKAVHKTFRMSLELLFNCCPPANCKPRMVFADGHPCKCEPGIIAY